MSSWVKFNDGCHVNVDTGATLTVESPGAPNYYVTHRFGGQVSYATSMGTFASASAGHALCDELADSLGSFDPASLV